jgi:hypothetical protein
MKAASEFVGTFLFTISLVAGLGALLAARAIGGAQAHSKGHGIQCSLCKVQDSERTNLICYTYLLPQGWHPENKVTWPGQLPSVNLKAQSADGTYMVDRVDPFNIAYSGGTNIPTAGLHIDGALDFLHKFIDQMQQKGIWSNVQVVDESSHPLPLTPMQQSSQQTPFPNTTATFIHESGFIKVTFEKNGKQESSSLGTVITGRTSHMEQKMPYGGATFVRDFDGWTVGPTVVVMTSANPSPAKVKETQIVLSTMRSTPDWNLKCAEIALRSAQQGLARTEANGAALRAQFARDGERRMANFRDQMGAKDANTRQFCNYILDQQDYKDPSGNTVTLPSSYKYAYANGQGQYYVTDEPDFDARGTDWRPMSKASAGK